MGIVDELDRLGIDDYLSRYRDKDLLRFLTCGSVDDGKSTLIGRLLHDSQMVYDDHLAAAKRDSAKFGTTGEELDFALLVDGLEAEREQGITIDVAYRYFTTEKRKFIIADTPGHEQYTRNMATGASNCQLAILMIDARYGVLDQTRRHAFITSLLGIQHVVCAVNKMDLVDYDEQVFEKIRHEFTEFAAKLAVKDLHFIPMSALKGENVVHRAESMPWYQGSPLLAYLETVHIASDRNLIDFRMPVQTVLRPNLDFRGFAGTISSGVCRVGDEVVSLPSGRQSKIASIETYDGKLEEAFAPMSVVLTLEDEIDASRGDVLAHVNNTPRLESRFEAMVVWMSDKALEPGRSYLLKQAANLTPVTVPEIRYRTNVNSLRKEDDASQLALNEIGRIEIEAMKPIVVEAYQKNRGLGAFILVDRIDNQTLACGMIVDRRTADRSLARRRVSADAGTNIREQHGEVTLEERQARLSQKPFTVWFTGLPRSGKTPTAFALEKALFDKGFTAHVLDGENLRSSISSDLGFSADDRAEHVRRASQIAKINNDIGLISIVALVSPIEADREAARRAVGEDRFVEVHCDLPVEVCERRDDSGLYERARKGEVTGLTGVDGPYDRPSDPAIRLDTDGETTEANVERLLSMLASKGLL